MLTAKTPYCPSQEDLADYAAGTVTAERLETLSAHVDTCVVCQATIAELSDSADSFVATLRTSQGVVEEESACRQALEQMLEQHGRVPPVPRKQPVPLPEYIGPYRVLEPIAAGGMGMVLRAQHPKLKRTVAIKLLPLQQWAGSTAIARFEREMEVIGNLDHPNIVRASDAGDAGGMHYLVMDFIDGTDLSRLVHRLGQLPVADACEIARQTAVGLQYVHNAGLIHRDIKPSNIMLTSDGRVKILDLGLAMLNEPFREDENVLTTVGQLMGTLDYMSPEQAADSRQVDARADIYSLGATLFKLLAGQPPYGGPNHRSLLKKVLALASGPVPSVRAIRSDVPIELDQIVRCCLDKNIEARFASVAEVAEALAPFAAQSQLSTLANEAAQRAHRDPAETPSWNWVRQDVDKPAESASHEAKPLPKPGKPRKLIPTIVGVAALALLIACGVLIRIATDRGELIVSSDDPNAQIRITRSADQSVEHIAVEKGEKRTVVKSGEYAVELLGDGDHWTLSANRFTMQRGGQVTLQVERVPVPSGSSDAAGLMGSSGMGSGGGGGDSAGAMPGMGSSANDRTGRQEMYDGKSYEEWMTLLQKERKPDRLVEAIKAVRVLKPKGDDERVARAILQWMRNWEWQRTDGTDRQFVSEARSLFQFLEPASALQVIRAELPQLNDRQADFLSLYFHTGFGEPSDFTMPPSETRNRWCRIVKDGAPTLVVEALEQSRRTDGSVDTSAMLIIAETLSTLAGLDVTKIDGFLPRFREALRSNDDRAVLSAASALVIHEPDTEGLAEIVRRFFENDTDRERVIQLLLRLGPRATPVVSTLIDQLLHAQDPASEYRLASAIARLLDDTVTSALETAARENSDEGAAARWAHVRQMAKQVSPAEPYGTIPEWNRSKHNAVPTEATPPKESDAATPNADTPAPDSSLPNPTALKPESPVPDPNKMEGPKSSDTGSDKTSGAEAGSDPNTTSPSASNDSH